MTKERRTLQIKKFINLLLILILTLLTASSIKAFNNSINISANISLNNGTTIPALNYDFDNSTNFTSYSFKDNSLINPNAYARVCKKSTNSSILNKYIELAHTNHNCSEILPLSVMPSRINKIVSNCSTTDIDIASYNALYPGVVSMLIMNNPHLYYTVNYTDNTTNTSYNSTEIDYGNLLSCKRTNTIMNGSYKLNVNVDDVAKTIRLSVASIRDSYGRLIDFSGNYGNLIYEMTNKTNKSLGTKVVKPKGTAEYNYTFKGGEKVYVNGLMSLKVIAFDPCGTINKSGYYMLNDSSWNVNKTCVVIENASKITLNFANKTINGDNTLNGSLRNNTCAIIIKDSKNISIEDLRTEQFYYGLCIINSSGITTSGTYDMNNSQGIWIENSSDVVINNLKLNNKNSEIYSKNATIHLNRLTSPSANFSLEAKNILVKTVRNPPPQPSGLMNISQWLTVKNTTENSWAIITFHYEKPLPNNVLEATLDLYKFDYNGTNTTNGTWYSIPSYTDKINKKIYSINLSNFSIFVPMGEEVNMTPKNPPPAPPSTGHIKQKIIENQMNIPPQPRPPRIKLRLFNHTIKIQQGGSGEVGFNVSNLGVGIMNLIVKANITREGWKSPEIIFKMLKHYETKNGTIFLSVYDNEIPGTYLVPVNAIVSNMTLDTDLLKVIVTPRGKLAKLKIIEAAPVINLLENKIQDFPILVKNDGDYNLTNITLSFKYADDCIDSVSGSYNLSVGEQKTISYKIKTKNAFKTCDAILLLKSNEKAIAFAPIRINVVPKKFGRFKILPILLLIFSILTIIILFNKYKEMRIAKKRNKKAKELI